MPKEVDVGKRKRLEFSRIHTTIPIPNLLDLQRESYRRFLQMDLLPEERENVGLEEAFRSVFPIKDFRGECSLAYMHYSLGDWKCRCGQLEGLQHLRQRCPHCTARVIVRDPQAREVQCDSCGQVMPVQIPRCPQCDDVVDLRVPTTVEECQERGMTYGIPLKIWVRVETYQKDAAGGAPSVLDFKEEEVFFGSVPLMTEKGTFIINGTERAVVSQLHRSPGVFYQANENRTEFVGKVIPARGSWVEFELDAKNVLHVRIDRKRRFPATVFLRALGLGDNATLLKRFYPVDVLELSPDALRLRVSDRLAGLVAAETLTEGKEVLVEAGKKIRRSQVARLKKSKAASVKVDTTEFTDVYAFKDVADPESGELLCESGQLLPVERLFELAAQGVETLEVILPKATDVGTALLDTLSKDVCKTQEEAYVDFFRKVRPGDPVTPAGAKTFFEMMFFDEKRYDFSRVGALKFLTKLHPDLYRSLSKKALQEELERRRILTLEDYCEIVEYLLRLKNNIGTLDDIDHLGNRRVRCVGELLENQIRIGLARMERATKEKMSVFHNLAQASPKELINAKPVVASILEFFGSSQLSQFMDQTNPLSEITHKRRLSALGPGGLSRERAGFEVRDVHTSHYGRLCPIETPEGPNIGLISSLSTYARINEFGFIESPYKKVENGRVLNHYEITFPGDGAFALGQVVEESELKAEVARCQKAKKTPPRGEPTAFYLTAWEEDVYTIAQANAPVDEEGNFINEKVQARKAGEFVLAPREEIQYIDVSPKQLVSIAAALIPFLEHDDANRALMGSNMQRQAVPLLRPKAPVVGTGMELVVGKDSESTVVCRRGGIVDVVDANRIIVRVAGGTEGEDLYDFGADVYPLTKFQRSNQNTCINQKPVVKQGDRVKAGDVLADGPCTDGGELALGRNVLVAFMPWRGYNYEDAILLSEKLVEEDVFTSIHIEELEIEARDTKLGKEEITRDIPNISEAYLKDLDESGIIRIGAHVKPGDILVGKVTPKGETQMTPEEKLLRAIFGEKSAEYRDASLRCPPGISGVIVDVKVFTRKGVEKDERTRAIEEAYVGRMEKNLRDQIRILREENRKKISDLLDGTVAAQPLYDDLSGEELVAKGEKLTVRLLSTIRADLLPKIQIQSKFKEAIARIREIEERTRRKIEVLEQQYRDKIANLERGDELLPGVIKMVKVYVAIKRKIQVGDKMAGRHGNKGVVSRILPVEDMPFLPDGTPVQIVLNPLGVPSRMNVGQILETHLGWAAKALGLHVSSPVFDGAKEEDIKLLLDRAGLPADGKIELRDGRTGEPMEQKVTVGYIYMMKLAHLVEDKIHARSIGPYSLITQQPLGGKAQFGGQRFGEMEVWALEAYGAANILQEILTVKSDDVYGRTKMYESIVKGRYPEEPGLPESFNVLVKELQGLAIDVNVLETEEEPASSDAGA
ncbi:MAG: DNA-directed RNA polymerase subunit beta [Acidobacteriota bacterium]